MGQNTESAKRLWLDDDYRARVISATREGKETPESKAKRSATSKALWNDPEYRAKMEQKGPPPNKCSEEEKFEKTCLQCQNKFLVLPSRVGKKFCNRKCKYEFQTNRPTHRKSPPKTSMRSGSGITGKFRGETFRSLYELAFWVNVAARKSHKIEYETVRVQLENGHWYTPDFVDRTERIIYEIKAKFACSRENVREKLEAGRHYATLTGFEFRVLTEEELELLTWDQIAKLVIDGDVTLTLKQRGGAQYCALLRFIEEKRCNSMSNHVQ